MPEENIKSFIVEYEQSTTPADATEVRVFGGNVKISCIPASKFIRLELISSFVKGQGHGTVALRWLADLADKHQVTLIGYCDRVGCDGLSIPMLVDWYKKNGFPVLNRLQIRREPHKKTGPKS